MRLLRTYDYDGPGSDLSLDEFYGANIPPYAILSHTWGEEEVVLSEILNGTAKSKKGFTKIRFAIDQARQDGHKYVWVDTCCIDKTSSAELSEAINSMYNWYKCAAICYAHLADVPADVDTTAEESAFTRSRWFTRGFCLQELLAPTDLQFYSENWMPIGSKHDLRLQVSRITRIDPAILSGERSLDTVSIAQKMAWAATRQTTRPEDIAYCLMGLFSVNMPMLYGEGARAFHRLQEEIIRHSHDHSIFAWTNPSLEDGSAHGLLADSPMDFIDAVDIVQYPMWEEQAPFVMSNRGLHITLQLTACGDDIYVAALNCPVPQTGPRGKFLAIYVRRLRPGIEQYARIKCSRLGSLDGRGHERAIYVQQNVVDTPHDMAYPTHAFYLRDKPATERYNLVKHVIPTNVASLQGLHAHRSWIPTTFPAVFTILKQAGSLTVALQFERYADKEGFWLLMGSITQSSIGFSIVDNATVNFKDMDDLQAHFRPQPPGKVMLLENHRVRVDAVTHIKGEVKSYMLDIDIEEISQTVPPYTLVEAAEVPTSRKKGHRWQIKAPRRLGFS